MEEQAQASRQKDPASLPVPDILPIMPLHGFVFFPGMGFPLQIGSTSAMQLVDHAMSGDRMIGLVLCHKKQASVTEEITSKDLHRVGVVGYIHNVTKFDEGYYQVLVSGVHKLAVTEYTQELPWIEGRITKLPMVFDEDNNEMQALLLNLRNQFKKLGKLMEMPEEILATLDAITDPYHIAYLVASQLNLKVEEEQEILEIIEINLLLHRVARELNKRLETVAMSNKLQEDIKKEIDGKQREFFLRQQMEAIRKELGEESDGKAELTELRKKAEAAGLSEEAQKAVNKELARLERISPSSPEHSVARNYVDWILDLPWNKTTEDTLDLDKAEHDLDNEHYGLGQVKKRILEFLAVRKLKNDIQGPILCLAGPPGVGKTSLGQSIAKTMGRKFIRMALGGLRDEAEIRGHRRTYIGALPGRIIQSLKRADSKNPVVLLDEIDKLGSDFRGDPSSALLEVLDPEQNSTFRDHYLDMEFDLSKILFIATANMLDTIPGPLRDRMEVVELSSYTENEKVDIARRYLLPKQLQEHALTPDNLEMGDAALLELIRSYTREAGVRNLERELASVCRGVAANIVRGNKEKIVVTPESLHDYLGVIHYFPEVKARNWGAGLATGLAWTPVGGKILFIETSKMKGKGGLSLTGKLGDVMKESAAAALTYLRSHATALNIDEDVFSQIDLHVHVPEGATPKDGPSAGVAMVSALYSVISGKPLRRDVAMTGEITLRGDVLPVGGINEKVLAALRAGIKELILPPQNEQDVLEMPEKVRAEAVFRYPHTIEEALEFVLDKQAEQ
ncbi:MAG: ATP-dependent Lon protease [Candidatus Electronema aureum]|uniref:Lon protease n=1 Tax=Candidatus Electronema aureum TaxID=2005002 RepID=A0A521G0G8_9BACT|nr:MAG: ATP-dependent Lon protease [Candidatus Electronema aureum]